ELASLNVRVWFDDGNGENPFFAMLGACDAILVTEDSTNMLTEACTTGKPVFTLPIKGKSGKFKQLYDELQERCHVSQANGNFKAPTYTPLNETQRAAQEILTRLNLP
ncbi:MAG: nucleoside-diphosphate sugar epimerase, partial [Acidimicrobiales bacterium]